MKSLRGRLIVGTICATLAIFAAAAIVLYIAIRHSLIAEFDRALLVQAQAISALAEMDRRGLRLDIEGGRLPQYESQSDAGYALFDGAGKEIHRSDGTPWLGAHMGDGSRDAMGFARLPGGGRARWRSLTFTPRMEDAEEDDARGPRQAGAGGDARVVVAQSAVRFDERLRILGWLLATVFATTSVATAGVMARVVGRGLLPMTRLAAQIGAIGERDLARRIESQDVPLEMLPVVQRLNDLLSRVGILVERERGFSADVAHELRTPLAGLVTTMEVAAMHPRPADEYRKTIQKCLAATQGMHAMVQTLLTLARADAGRLEIQRRHVDLASLVGERWKHFADAADARDMDVRLSLTPAGVATDRELASVVIDNLIDNAVAHGEQSGWIELRVTPDGSRVVLIVRNSGSRIAPSDCENVFGRFWRGDSARTMTGLHSGLGLSLCRRTIEMLGGSIVATSDGGVFEVKVILPSTDGSDAITTP